MARETAASPTFEELGLPEDIVEALAKAGIVEPTPIQELCIPAILQGKDVVGKAETGTGKTVGFGAPIALRVDTNRVAPQALVLAPTRELAQQVAGVLVELGAPRNLRVALLVGGVHAMSQVAALRGGAQVVVGTPGRVLDFLQGGILSLVWVEIVVLDEADRMLDMGFIDDVTAILERVPEERQTLLFSATMPPEVEALLHRYMKDPAIFSTASGLATVPEIRQFYVACEFPRKFRELERILKAFRDETVLVFSNTRRQAIDLDRMLWGHGYSAASLHGERDQDERFRVLQAFRSGDVRILVATDVASRGLDIEDVGCVVNYEVPADPESYVHRIGRTGRAKKTGTAISLVARKERRAWETILRETKFTVNPWRPEGAKERRPGGGHEASARRAASGDSSMDEEKRENGEEPGGPRGPGRSGPSPGPSPAAEGR
ncbi:MAG: DEAD/DEAH box helicase, partial [Planctomycetota bacterium]